MTLTLTPLISASALQYHGAVFAEQMQLVRVECTVGQIEQDGGQRDPDYR